MGSFIGKAIGDFLGFVLNHLFDGRFQTFSVQGFSALFVNHLPLLVHDVIIFQKLLSDIKVVTLNLCLGIFDGFADQFIFYGLTVFHPKFFHNSSDSFATEYP